MAEPLVKKAILQITRPLSHVHKHSPDDLVGLDKKRGRQFKTKRSRGAEIEAQAKALGPLDRKIGDIGPIDNPSGHCAGTAAADFHSAIALRW